MILTRRRWISLLAPAPDLLIAAASDLAALQSPLSRLAGGPIRFSFGSSGMLARQIENGAPFDVFLSADERLAQDLVRARKLEAERVYATGRVALFSKNPALRNLDALRTVRFRHVALANPQHAPYGRAARQALESAGLWKQLEPRVVLAENVRQALQFAESGNAEVAFTAWSLVHAKGGSQVDAQLHQPIRQMGAVVVSSARRDRARRFLDALTGEAGRSLLRANGFE